MFTDPGPADAHYSSYLGLPPVVRDTGAHACVAHQSHGITFRDVIAYNTYGDAY